MAESGKKVEVRFGAFSCSIEGYDNPVEQMREVLLLMQGMIRETPALADHGPGFGEAEVARIEHALDRRAERQAGGPGIVVIRGPEATRNGDHEAEDAVTTADIPPGARRPADAPPETAFEAFPEIPPDPAAHPDEQPQVAAGEAEKPEGAAPGAAPGIFAAPVAEDETPDRAGDDQAGHGLAGAGREDGDPEQPLDDGTGAAPAAAAIFSAPAAAMAEAAFSADLAGIDEPEPGLDAGTDPGVQADEADAERAGSAGASPPAETAQVDMAADADAAEHSNAAPAPSARAEEANRLWDAALPEPGEALDEAAPPADAPRGGEPAADAARPDPFVPAEAAEFPGDLAEIDRQPRTAGEHGQVPEYSRAADAAEEQTPADGDRATGSHAPAAGPDRPRDEAVEEPSTGASDRDLQAAAQAALAAHGFGPDTAGGGDRQAPQAGRGRGVAPERRHEPSAGRRLNIFAPPSRPAGRVAPAAAATNIFAPPSDAGAGAVAAAVNIFAPPSRAPSRDATPREAARAGRLFARTAAGPARQPAANAWMATAAPDDEDDPDPAPRPNGVLRARRPGNGTHDADRHEDAGRTDHSVNLFAAPRAAAPQPASPPPALRREPGPAAAAWDGSADEADGDNEARPAGKAPGRPGTGWPGAAWSDGLDDGDDGRPDGGPGGAAAWNDGLRELPRPPRAQPNEERSRFSALLARLGGRRTAETPQAKRHAPSTAARDGGDASPADLAERAGASSVADLLAVAAAWLTLVEGKPRFTRREVMETFERLPGNHPRTLEARIKGFGKLVRASTLILVDDGVFAMAQAERDRYQAMIDDG